MRLACSHHSATVIVVGSLLSRLIMLWVKWHRCLRFSIFFCILYALTFVMMTSSRILLLNPFICLGSLWSTTIILHIQSMIIFAIGRCTIQLTDNVLLCILNLILDYDCINFVALVEVQISINVLLRRVVLFHLLFRLIILLNNV